MKKVIVTIERGEDGGYSLYAPDLQNVIIGMGDTVEQAKEDFAEGYREMVETYQEDGVPVPEELQDVEFEYRYDAASMLAEAGKYINLAALARETGINATLIRQYKKGQYISAKQAQRLQEGLQSMSRKIAACTLV
ncbi:MAG: type II toxin-antitoxin system HicB family antitoxin [Paludibacteraceae bacterium]